MGKQFTAFVHVDDGNGKSRVFSPGDVMPEWAEAHVHNPKVWSGSSDEPATTKGPAPVEPPRSGPGSGRQAWVDYAKALDVHVEDDASREDIIAAVASPREE